MVTDIFNLNSDPYEVDTWADDELERLAADLELKRAKAIKYLGNKWILKGGKYNRSNSILGEK